MSPIDYLEKGVALCFSCIPRSKPKKPSETVQLIAHRGAHDTQENIIENTDEAFAQALKLGCWGIELDVHETADNVLVVNHDATLKRLWNNNQHIKSTTFETLRTNTPLIPRLDEVVEKYGKRMHLFIELKHSLIDDSVLAHTLRGLIPGEDYHLLALKNSIFKSLKHFPSHALLLVPCHDNVSKFCKLSLDNKYGGVLAHYLLLSQKKAKALRDANQSVGVGFIDSKYSLYRELKRGHQWLFTNAVKRVRHHLNALR